MNAFTGTGQLLRLALRRDRILIPSWIAVFVFMAVVSATATVGLYPDVASRVTAAEVANGTPSIVAIYGPIYDPTSLGGVSMLKMTVLGAAMVAVLTIILTVRHTRAEEETGRMELVESAVVGRFAPLAAALALAWSTSVVLGLLTAVGLIAAGLSAAGSLAFGLLWAGVGIAYAAVAAVMAQLTRSARAATGLSLSVLGITYLLRAFADASSGRLDWISWLSPLGIGQQIRAYADNRMWVVLILLALAAVLSAVAFWLLTRRDLGAGILKDRAGPANAGATLGSPLGLAWHLQRGVFVGWLVALAVLGLMLGNLASSALTMVNSPEARDLFAKLGGSEVLSDAFLAAELGFVGFMVGAYAIYATLRLRSEETAAHAEMLLATGVTRLRWALSHLTIAVLGSAVLFLVVGLTTGGAYAAAESDPGQVGRLIAAALVALPAVWVLIGVVVALFGFLPRYAAAGSWAVLIACLMLSELGPLLKINQFVLDLSPFAHIPKMPGGQVTALPLIVLTVVALALTVLGLIGFRRRDIT